MNGTQDALLSPDLEPAKAIRERNAILALIANDPRNSEHVRAVATAIADNFAVGDCLSANDVRPLLPSWIKPHVIGPAFGMLRRRGALALVGYVPSTDPGTHGKPVARYRVAGAA